MGQGGWSSDVLSRLIVGFPYPTSTGIGIIAGPAAVLPPPLDTYLDVGIVWVAEGAMSYIGVLDVAGVEQTEYGFVHPNGSIVAMVRLRDNGLRGLWEFVGDPGGGGGNYTTVKYTGPMDVTFLQVDVYFEDGQFWFNQGSLGSGQYTFDPEHAQTTVDAWEVVYDVGSVVRANTGASLQVVDMQISGSGTIVNDFSFTITSYGTTASAGVYSNCGAVFIAPPSGRVLINARCQLYNSVASTTSYLAPEVREGGVIGSGTVFQAAADTVAIGSAAVAGTNPGLGFRGFSTMITGLTPGSTYNVRLLHRVTANTGRTLIREIIVIPSL